MVSRSSLHFVTRARRGDGAAQFALGKLYLEGAAGLPRNHAVALDWLLRATRQGIDEASRVIARSIAAGVARDSSALFEILGIYRRHAEDGDPISQASYVEIVDSLPDTAIGHDPSALQAAARYAAALARSGDARTQWRLARAPGAALDEAPRSASDETHGADGATIVGTKRASPCERAGERVAFARNAAPWIESLLEQDRAVRPDCASLLFEFYRAAGWADTLARDALIAAAEAGLSQAQFELGRLQLDADQLDARNKVHAHDHEAVVRLVLTGAAARPPASLRAAVRWLTLAAAQAHPDAAYLLGIVHRIPAFSRRNPGVSDHYFRRGAQLGQRDAAYWLGAHLWRARARSKGADVEAVAWLIAAADAGHTPARNALDAIAPNQEASPSPFDRFDAESIARWSQCFPLMAERIALGRAFRLKRIEALLLDVRAADRGRFLVLDVSQWTSKHARRMVLVVTDEQRLVLARAAHAFSEIDTGRFGPERGYRQRLYLLNKLVKQEAAALAAQQREKACAQAGVVRAASPRPRRKAKPGMRSRFAGSGPAFAR